MRQSSRPLMRVHWHLGQGLLPEHFYAQEESLRAEAALRFNMQSRPAWGLGNLVWDPADLRDGNLRITELSLVLESGVVLDIPGNAAKLSLDLNQSGSTQTPVHVHLESGFDVVRSRPGDADEEGIERLLQKVTLSVDPGPASRSFKLVEVAVDAKGKWSLRHGYLPPLLCMRNDLLCDGLLRRMRDVGAGLRRMLKEEIQVNYLSGESQLLGKQALRSVLAFEALLGDVGAGIALHPYDLFVALRTLYIDVAVQRNVSDIEAALGPYDHEDIAKSFNQVLEPAVHLIEVGRPEVPYVKLELRDGRFTCPLGKDVHRAIDVFLMIQKPQVATQLDLERVKLASPKRLPIVHERALNGIPYKAIERPPFAQTLASTVDIFQLVRGQEWDFAVEAGCVALFDAPVLRDCQLYLYARIG